MLYLKSISRQILSLVCVVIIALLIITEVNAETVKILWLTDDSKAEKVFLSQQNDSIDSEVNNLILTALKKTKEPNYALYFQLAQIPRINILLKSQQNACVSNRVKTPQRERYSVYSNPIDLYLGYRLYYLKNADNIPRNLLDKNNQLTSLASLFKMFPNRVLAISKGRSYGEYFDQEFKGLPIKNIYLRAGANRYAGTGQMLLKKRIDYLVEFPESIHSEMNLEQSKLELKSVGIVNSPNYILGYIACSDTPTGHRIIKKINEILLDLYKTDAFYQAHTKYINKADIPVFDRYFHDVFN